MAIVTLQARKGVADLLGSDASPATLGTSYAAGGTSSAANPDGADWMAFYIYVDAKSTAGRLDFQVEVSPSGDTAVATDWARSRARPTRQEQRLSIRGKVRRQRSRPS